jgi:hypothetical protein
MQICDFCGIKSLAQDQTTVRRFDLRLQDKDANTPMSPNIQDGYRMPEWSRKTKWWELDLCAVCHKQVTETLDNLVLPETDGIPKIKKGPNFEFKRMEEEIKVKTPKK